MDILSIAICDDNRIALESEAELVKSVLREMGISHTVEIFNDARQLLKSETVYDIIFLDIEMDDLNGIETAKEIREINKDCLIFFATNYEAYLDDALNQHAFRYWTKPIDRQKLIYGIKSAIKELEASRRYITITVCDSKKQILIHNIIYVYMENKRLHLITTKGELTTNDTYKDIYEQLRTFGDFIETCRGYCVNFKYVKDYTHENVVCAYNKNIYKIDISRRKYNRFHESFVNWIGEMQ